jgi:heme-degrading monooxygenase HmoA
MAIAHTPEPPYVAVIFTSARKDGDHGYAVMAGRMDELAAQQPGYLGHDGARSDGVGVTVSYWESQEAAAAWKQVAAHRVAQARGIEAWYEEYVVRIAVVERAYSGPRELPAAEETRPPGNRPPQR